MKTSEVLRQAKALIENPAHWCKEALAVNERDESTAVNAPDAVQFCAIGAVYRVCGTEPTPLPVRDEAEGCIGALEAELDGEWRVPVYNDHPNTTHADIMKLFDRAIAKAESEGR